MARDEPAVLVGNTRFIQGTCRKSVACRCTNGPLLSTLSALTRSTGQSAAMMCCSVRLLLPLRRCGATSAGLDRGVKSFRLQWLRFECGSGFDAIEARSGAWPGAPSMPNTNLCAFLNGMMFALSADRFEFAAALTSRKVRCSPSSPCSHAKGALRVAPGGSAPPILYVACRSFGGAGRDGKAGSRIEQESWHYGALRGRAGAGHARQGS
jgi:hypothetical protein